MAPNLIESEGNLDCDQDRDGHAGFHRGFKPIFSDRRDGILIHTRFQAFDYARVLRHAVCIDNDGNKTVSANLLGASFVRIHCLHIVERNGRGNSTTDPRHPLFSRGTFTQGESRSVRRL